MYKIINNYWMKLSKISWFASGESAEANNWSARQWYPVYRPPSSEEKLEKEHLWFTVVIRVWRPRDCSRNVWKMIWLAVIRRSLHHVNEGFWLALRPVVKTCYSMHYDAKSSYMLERKALRKTSVTQTNSKGMFHTITSLWVVSDLSALYFKLMTFRIQWEGLHKIMDLFLQ